MQERKLTIFLDTFKSLNILPKMVEIITNCQEMKDLPELNELCQNTYFSDNRLSPLHMQNSYSNWFRAFLLFVIEFPKLLLHFQFKAFAARVKRNLVLNISKKKSFIIQKLKLIGIFILGGKC